MLKYLYSNSTCQVELEQPILNSAQLNDNPILQYSTLAVPREKEVPFQDYNIVRWSLDSTNGLILA